VRRVAILPLDLDVAHRVGIGFGRGDAPHLVDAVLEEAMVAADGRAELLRFPDLLDLRDEELGLVAVHPLTLLRVVGEVSLAHLHEMPEALVGSLLALGIRSPELVEMLLHQRGVAGDAGVNADALPGLDAEQTRSIRPSVTAHVGRETFALFAPLVVVLVVVVVTVRESADRDEVSDRRSGRLLHPVIEHLAVEVAAVARAVHREDARVRTGLRQPKMHGAASVTVLLVVRQAVLVFRIASGLFEMPLPRASGVVLDVLTPLLSEPSLPERLLHDLLGGDRVAAELVRTAAPRVGEVDDGHLAIRAACELEELLLRDAATVAIAILVVELVAVGRENAVERAHRTDAVRDDRDGVALLREADVLRRHGREVGLPRELTGLGREPRLDDIGERGHAAVLAGERHGLLEGRDEPLRVVESHRVRSHVLVRLFHCDTLPFLSGFGLQSDVPPWAA